MSVFRSGHSYVQKNDGGHRKPILCISVNHRTAVFRNGDSFSVKSLDKIENYDDLGVKADWRSFLYRIIG